MHDRHPMYSEFDDCEFSGSLYAEYCSSEQARNEIKRLMREHNLGFLFNPGGGQFTRANPYFNCQVMTYDDVEDLNTLRKALGL